MLTAATPAHHAAAKAFVAMLPDEAKPAASLFYRYALLLAMGVPDAEAQEQARQQEQQMVMDVLYSGKTWDNEPLRGKVMVGLSNKVHQEAAARRRPETDDERSERAGREAAQRRHTTNHGFIYPNCPAGKYAA